MKPGCILSNAFHNKVDENKNWFLAGLGHDLINGLVFIF